MVFESLLVILSFESFCKKPSTLKCERFYFVKEFGVFYKNLRFYKNLL